LKATLAETWAAISDRDRMKEWYFDLPEFTAETGCRFRFSGGPNPEKQYLHVCEVKRVIPPTLLAYSWRYDGVAGDSLVTFELGEVGSKTRLKLTHSGVETFPAANPDFARKNFMVGWIAIVNESLRNYLEKPKEVISAQVEKEPAKTEHLITIQTIIKAPIATVWAFWTLPEHIVNWNFASDDWFTPTAKNNLIEGGKFDFRMESKCGSFGFNFKGRYIEIVHLRKISYQIDDGRNVTVAFSNDTEKTLIVETFEAETINSVDLQKAGWQAILDNFKNYAEKINADEF
jgi:uncharacterized protein YndB with AHSA1/START domain